MRSRVLYELLFLLSSLKVSHTFLTLVCLFTNNLIFFLNSWVCSHSLIQSTLISDWFENVPLNLRKVSKCFNFKLFSLLYSLLAWVYFLFQFWKAFHWKCHWTWLQFILITWAWSESCCGKDVYEGQPLWKTGDQSFFHIRLNLLNNQLCQAILIYFELNANVSVLACFWKC